MQIHVSEVYTDKITATADRSEFIPMCQDFTDLVESMGGRVSVLDDGYRELRLPDNEQILLEVKHRVARATINGRACAALRAAKRFAEALAIIGSRPHRVTQIHAKVDTYGDDLPARLAQVSAAALTEGLFGQSADKSRSLVEVRPDGQQAVNTYIGRAKAEMQRAYYDKRLERHVRGYRGFDESCDEVSVELRVQKGVRRAGLSLRDAYDPRAMFWHYMADCPLVGPYKPAEVGEWEVTGSGFDLEPYKRRTAVERVQDWERFGDWIGIFRQAAEAGVLEDLLRSLNSRGKALLAEVSAHA